MTGSAHPDCSRTHAVLYLAVPLILVALIGMSTDITSSFGGMDFDGQHYASMHAAMRGDGLRNSSSPVALRAPYCWRVGAPFLSSLLCSNPVQGFQYLNRITMILTIVLLWAGCRKTGLSCPRSLAAVCLYTGIFWTVKFSFYSPCYIDWSMMPFLAVLPVFLEGSSPVWIPVLLAAGVLFKETVMFAAPALLAAAGPNPLDRNRKIRLFFAAVAGSLAVVFLVRYSIRAEVSPEFLQPIRLAVRDMGSIRFWSRLPLEILSGLGVLPLLLLIPVNLRDWWRKHPWIAVWLLTGLVVIWGGRDKARLLLFVAVPMAITGGEIFGRIWQRGRPARVWIGATVLLHAYLGHHLWRIQSFNEYLASMVPLHYSGDLGVRPLVMAGAVTIWLAAGWVVARRPGV